MFRAGRGPWSVSAAPRQWGGGEPDTADSGNEICVVICARSGRGPWALANLTEELRSREGPRSRGVVGAETQAGVEGAPAGVCVWVPWGVCICAFWFSQSVCVFPWLMWTSFKGMLGEHLASCSCVEISRVCVCVSVCTQPHIPGSLVCTRSIIPRPLSSLQVQTQVKE